ncbi:MAG: hypothetical protein QHJ73_19945, partial [Armatimonadota bacterium]|nr:hypothetical protein [Armatimonadota bacterium]
MSETLILRLAQGVGLFCLLHAAYWFLFKRGGEKGTLLSVLLQRSRVGSYLLVFVVSAWWVLEAWLPRESAVIKLLEALLAATCLSVAAEVSIVLVFEWLLPARSRMRLPYLLQSLARGAAYLMIFLALLRQLGADVSSILAGSAIFSVVMGLALQETLGNL